MAHVQVVKKDKILLEGYITFIHADLKGRPIPHGITIIPTSSEDKKYKEEAKRLRAETH